MSGSQNFKNTIYACFTGYIVQAIVNNFVPLLFVTFQREFSLPLSKITLLVTFNFGLQLLTDLASVKFVDRIGYRISAVLAHLLSAAGLILLTILPGLMKNSFVGILICVMIYAIGGGLLEVLISPIVEACPTDNKEAAMSLLHSFYCWGHLAVVLLSTLFFAVFGLGRWRVMALLWALVPIANGIAFLRVPIRTLAEDSGVEDRPLKEILGLGLFWLFFVLMICSGAVLCTHDLFRRKRAGGKPVGLNLCGKRPGRAEMDRRSGRPHDFCRADGDCKGDLREIRRPHSPGPFYDRQYSTVHSIISADRSEPGYSAGGCCRPCRCGLVRLLRGHHVARHLQSGVRLHPGRRDSHVRAPGSGGGRGLHERADPGRFCLRRFRRQSAGGDPCGNFIPAAYDQRAVLSS